VDKLCRPCSVPSAWLHGQYQRLRLCHAPFRGSATAALFLLLSVFAVTARAQFELEKPPINYLKATPEDVVSRLQKRLKDGSEQLEFDERFGYLPSLLEKLEVPRSSQVLVFSKTSLQVKHISPRTPRAIYFSDDAYVGWVQGGHIELSAVDPQLGANFYLLEQRPFERPRFQRHTYECLQCHGSMLTRDVPGHMVRSVHTAPDGHQVASGRSYLTDHGSPFQERWGGWYVTGEHGDQRHLGNLLVRRSDDPQRLNLDAGANAEDLSRWLEPSSALTGHSDIVALMVLEHQANLHNRITRANFVTRGLLYEEQQANREAGRPETSADDPMSKETEFRLRETAESVVEHLLFTGELKLTAPVVGRSGFTAEFSARGPRDRQGRSLRDFDLRTRMFKHPCSYLVYSRAFQELPRPMKDLIYRRLWEVLTASPAAAASLANGDASNGEKVEDSPTLNPSAAKYAHLSTADRRAIREILRDTKTDLPEYWK
jgi:hypothetical protein